MIHKTDIMLTLFTHNAVSETEFAIVQDAIKAMVQKHLGGVVDVTKIAAFGMSDEAAQDELWERGFEPTIMEPDDEFDPDLWAGPFKFSENAKDHMVCLVGEIDDALLLKRADGYYINDGSDPKTGEPFDPLPAGAVKVRLRETEEEAG